MKTLRLKKPDVFNNGELTNTHMKKGDVKNKKRIHIDNLNMDIFVNKDATPEEIEEIKLKYIRNAKIK